MFLILINSGTSQSLLPPGAYEPLNCRGPVMFAEGWGGDGMPVAPNVGDCLNQASLYNWVYVGMSGCFHGQDLYNCRSCSGCTQLEVDTGRCMVNSKFAVQFSNTSDPNYPCDAMGGILYPSTNPIHAQMYYGNNKPAVLTDYVYLFKLCACARVERLPTYALRPAVLTRPLVCTSDKYVLTSPSPPPSPPVLGPPPPSPAPPQPPASGYTTHAGTNTSFYSAGAYFVDAALFARSTDCGPRQYWPWLTDPSDLRGEYWTRLDPFWSVLAGTGFGGPWAKVSDASPVANLSTAEGMTMYTNAVTSVVKQCQDTAMRYGFDHVFLENTKRYTDMSAFAITANCWACDSTTSDCNYYSGGKVQSATNCSSAAFQGLPFNGAPYCWECGGFATIYQLPMLPQCTTSGCRYCSTPDGYWAPVMQVYRRTPGTIQAKAILQPYVGANPATNTFYDPAFPDGIYFQNYDQCPWQDGLLHWAG